jgi:hypothetical protein
LGYNPTVEILKTNSVHVFRKGNDLYFEVGVLTIWISDAVGYLNDRRDGHNPHVPTVTGRNDLEPNDPAFDQYSFDASDYSPVFEELGLGKLTDIGFSDSAGEAGYYKMSWNQSTHAHKILERYMQESIGEMREDLNKITEEEEKTFRIVIQRDTVLVVDVTTTDPESAKTQALDAYYNGEIENDGDDEPSYVAKSLGQVQPSSDDLGSGIINAYTKRIT